MTDLETTERAEGVKIEPLRDGEKKVISPKQYPQGNYGLEARRDSQFSSLMFFSEEPLNEVHRTMTQKAPNYGTPEYEAWNSLYGAINSSVAKCHLAEEESILPDGNRGHTMLIVANYTPTEDFRERVLAPMMEQGYISEEVFKLFV